MKRLPASAAALFLCAAALLLCAGCESAESNDVTVSPVHATIHVHGSVALSASGWGDFRWSLSDTAIGSLSATVGKSVVYTAHSAGTQRVTATAIGFGGGNSSTNSNLSASAAGYSATAAIEQR